MKIIVPVTDFCAKELFANEIIRKQFISDVTGIPMPEIHAAYLCTPFLRRRYRKQKQGILDVLVELNNSTKEDLDMIITKNPGINMAIEEVKRMSLSERMRAKYEAYLKEVRDQNTWEEYLRDEGRAEGRAEGRVEGQAEGCMLGSNREKEKMINRLLGKGKKPEEITELLGYSQQEIEDVRCRGAR